ncbi:MAG: helix-turn-helix transcriptional regulator [Pseudomonadota bacterium]
MDDMTDSIGDRIRAARKAAGLNQSALAERLGVTQPAVANWESGVHDPRRIMLAKLSDALSVSLDWLAGGARSAVEADAHPAAAYLRRPIRHAPIIGFADAVRFWRGQAPDPHEFAEDYIPVTVGSDAVFALFVTDDERTDEFPAGALVVVDYGDRRPAEGAQCLAYVDGRAAIRRWRGAPPDDPGGVIGCVRVSIRVH